MSTSALSDVEIVSKVIDGDAELFGILMERYEAKLSRYGTRFLSRGEDITDMVQDVFISAYKNLQSFDPALSFSSWIYRIAHNAFVNELRRKSRHPLVLPAFDEIFANAKSSDRAEEASEQKEIKSMVEEGVRELIPAHREILTLYFTEELSYKDIADVLRIPLGTVGVRLQRAKRALRAVYTKRKISL